jgi:hypothetical protein
MGFIDDAVDVSVALGKGIYSVGQDVVFGFERTGEGLGMGDGGRMATIGYENRAMISLIERFVKHGVKSQKSPLYWAIVYVLEHYYSYFPDEAVSYLAKQAGMGAAYTGGRVIIGKKLAEMIAMRIAAGIAASATYKVLAKRLGVSAGASATGIGTPIGLLMAQGIMQRSSHASTRLKLKVPELYVVLKRNGDLQLIYFLIEKPLKTYIDAISVARQNVDLLHGAVNKKYNLY